MMTDEIPQMIPNIVRKLRILLARNVATVWRNVSRKFMASLANALLFGRDCHPDRSSCFAKRSNCVVEGPAFCSKQDLTPRLRHYCNTTWSFSLSELSTSSVLAPLEIPILTATLRLPSLPFGSGTSTEACFSLS